MKKYIFFILFLTFILVLSCSTSDTSINNSGSTTIVILHTNDHHGHPLKFDNFPDTSVGGLPARAALVNELRSQYKNVLLLDSGDMNTGRPESSFFKAEPDILGYNYLKYDAMTLGNHEFDNTIEVLKSQMKQARFPFLSANIKDKNGEYIATPYIIKKIAGLNIAIFGLTTSETLTIGNPVIVNNIIVEDEIKVASVLVSILREKADIVIALVHMGIYDSDNLGSKKLASIKGIDLIIDGHTHTKLSEPVYAINSNTPIVEAWQWGLMLGKAILTVENKKLTGFTWEAIPINIKTKDQSGNMVYIFKELKENLNLLKMLEPFNSKVETLLAEVIGTATDVFEQKDVRLKETALGNLVADSMLYFTKNYGVDFAISNAGGIRKEIAPGKITKKIIFEVSPFDNSVMILTLSGLELQNMLNFIATIPVGKGGFPVVSKGVSFTINQVKSQCENILINGKPLNPKGTYKIATNSFMALGGDGYTMLLKASNVYDSSLFQRDVLIDYIKIQKTITPITENRITIIPKPVAFLWYLLRIA